MTVPAQFSCSQCDFSSSKEKKMTKHMQKTHPAVKNGGISKKSSKHKNMSLPSADFMPGPSMVQSEIPQFGQEKTMACAPQSASLPERRASGASSPAVFTCPFCPSESHHFSSLNELSAHKKSKHKEITLNCCFCEFSTSVLRKWHKHLRTAHGDSIDPLLNVVNIYFSK